VNTANSARALLLVAFFGAGAMFVHAEGSCIACHGNQTTMKTLVVPPSGGSAEGEG